MPAVRKTVARRSATRIKTGKKTATKDGKTGKAPALSSSLKTLVAKRASGGIKIPSTAPLNVAADMERATADMRKAVDEFNSVMMEFSASIREATKSLKAFEKLKPMMIDNEDAADAAAADAAIAALEDGSEELVPGAVVARLAAGENPIKVWREFRELSQQELADAADTSAAYVSQIERGDRNAGRELVKRLAAALNIDPSDLVSWDD